MSIAQDTQIKTNLRTFGNAWNHIGDAIDLLETVRPMTKEVEATIRALEKSARDVCFHMDNVKKSVEEEMERE